MIIVSAEYIVYANHEIVSEALYCNNKKKNCSVLGLNEWTAMGCGREESWKKAIDGFAIKNQGHFHRA